MTNGAATIRVAILDENELFALGLRAALSGAARVEVADEPPFDVAVVSSAAAAEQSIPCPLVLCGEPPATLAKGNAVRAVLPRSTLTPGQLLASIHATAAGLRVSPHDALPAPSRRLDGRRLEVLQMLADGADTREIALRLGYSDRTIKSVIREIQVALGTRNRAQAVAEGVRQGLIVFPAET